MKSTFGAVVLLTLLSGPALATAQDTPRMGGVLKAAMIGEPPSLDLHATSATITQQITWHIYENLFTYDRQYSPVPMLAESATPADGGRRYTIKLRRGVKFHNGKEMTSADGPLKDFVGTGPYRFVEHKPDRHLKIARFKDYVSRAEPPNGFGGKRTAYVDEILFIPVPDVTVRLAGVETGEYHFAQQIKQDQYDRINGLSAVEAR